MHVNEDGGCQTLEPTVLCRRLLAFVEMGRPPTPERFKHRDTIPFVGWFSDPFAKFE